MQFAQLVVENQGWTIDFRSAHFSQSFHHLGTCGASNRSAPHNASFQVIFFRLVGKLGLTRSMAFVSSPEFQSRYGSLQAAQDIARTAESSSMFAGLSASTAPNLLDEHAFPQAGDPPGATWTGQIQARGSIGQGLPGFVNSLQNHIATAGVTHDPWVHIG